MTRQVVLSGIRATGKMHIGNYLGAMRQFVEMQDVYDCFFFVADYHTLTTTPDPEQLKANLPEIVKDYLAVGLDPSKCTLFAQSSVPEIAELSLLLSMVMPIGELMRCPSFKDKARKNPDNVNLGLLSYPVLMTADILWPKANLVPVGEDQLSHLEITRDIARKFNSIYGQTFPIPEPLREKAIRVPGLDGTEKMGKSEGNTINLDENSENIRKIIGRGVTDPARVRRNDPGNPYNCNIFTFHEYLSDAVTVESIKEECKSASIGCVDCKALLSEAVIGLLEPFQERRREIDSNPGYVAEVLHEGGKKARAIAIETVAEVRDKMGIIRY